MLYLEAFHNFPAKVKDHGARGNLVVDPMEFAANVYERLYNARYGTSAGL